MYAPFYICAGLGFTVIVAEIRALFLICRFLRAAHTPRSYRHWFQGSFLASGLLLLSVPFHIYPIGGGTMLGFPFFAWWQAHGEPLEGMPNFLSLAGDALVWFLAPQLVLACLFHRWQRSAAGIHANPA